MKGVISEKRSLSRWGKLIRLLVSVVDPRSWLHLVKLLNYYNYSHVTPLRQLKAGTGCAISPDAVFSNPANIELGDRVEIGSRCHLWAGADGGKVIVGDECLFGPEVMLTAATYRFNDGQPVTRQKMDAADIVIGRDVWFGTRAIVLPGVRIGDHAVIGANTLVNRDIPDYAIVVGQPG